MATQLRIYKIQPGKMDDFLKGWEQGVVPLRRQQGFRVDGAESRIEQPQPKQVLTVTRR